MGTKLPVEGIDRRGFEHGEFWWRSSQWQRRAAKAGLVELLQQAVAEA